MENETQKLPDIYWNLFVELRKEILESQKIRTQIFGFKITLVSAGIGIIVANVDKVPRALLVIPAFASIFFDLLIIGWSFSIIRIGYYCRKYLEKTIHKSLNLPPGFRLWEQFMGTDEAKPPFRLLGNLGLTFLAVILAVIALWIPIDWVISGYNWLISGPLTLLLIVFLI